MPKLGKAFAQRCAGELSEDREERNECQVLPVLAASILARVHYCGDYMRRDIDLKPQSAVQSHGNRYSLKR